jgi:hypothetical protein
MARALEPITHVATLARSMCSDIRTAPQSAAGSY